MRDLAKEAYEACAIGATCWMRPDPERGETIEGFQSVVDLSAPALQEARRIIIQALHRETQTGRRLVDAIKFMRLR